MAGSLHLEPGKFSQTIRTQEEIETLNRDVKHKLFALHSYQVIAQKNLTKFDSSLKELELSDLYKSYTYFSLTASRAQIQKIEDEIQALHLSSPQLIEDKMKELTLNSPVYEHSFHLLSGKLKLATRSVISTPEEIEKEYQRLSAIKEFQVFEKNIEHLAHLTKAKARSHTRMPASVSEQSETEFPSETFDTLDWLAQSSDKIRARTNMINQRISRKK